MFIPDCFKSLQRGFLDIPGSDTTVSVAINAVNLNYAFARIVSKLIYGDEFGGLVYQNAHIYFASSTVLTAARHVPGGPALTRTEYEVVEVYPNFVKSMQRVTVNILRGATSASVAITPVNLAKAHIMDCGFAYTGTHPDSDTLYAVPYFVDASTIAVFRGGDRGDTNSQVHIWERK